jgi:hypothetical protein
MTISSQDLEVYAPGKIVITRSFLSTSKTRLIAEIFPRFDDAINYLLLEENTYYQVTLFFVIANRKIFDLIYYLDWTKPLITFNMVST